MPHEEDHYVHEIGDSLSINPEDYAPGTVITNVKNLDTNIPQYPPDAQVIFNDNEYPGWSAPGDWRKTKLVPNSTASFDNSGYVIKHTDNHTIRSVNQPNSWQGFNPLRATVSPTNPKFNTEKKNWFLRYSIRRVTRLFPGIFIVLTATARYITGALPSQNRYYTQFGAYPTIWDQVPTGQYAGLWGRGQVGFDLTKWRLVQFGNPVWHNNSDDLDPNDPSKFIPSGTNKEGLILASGDIDPDTGIPLDLPDYYSYTYLATDHNPALYPNGRFGILYNTPVDKAFTNYIELQFSFDDYIFPHAASEPASMWPAPLYKRTQTNFPWAIYNDAGEFQFFVNENNSPDRYGISAIRPFKDFDLTPVPLSQIPAFQQPFGDAGP